MTISNGSQSSERRDNAQERQAYKHLGQVNADLYECRQDTCEVANEQHAQELKQSNAIKK